jgi:hypothetical protein
MVTIVEYLPKTGYQPPTPEEARRLFEIVTAAHPALIGAGGALESEFPAAMLAIGMFFRTAQPRTDQYWSYWCERAADILVAVGERPVSGSTLLAAVIAHGDVPFRLPDRARGQLLEVALNAFSGAKCSNAWRRVLSGEASFLASVPSAKLLIGFQTVRSASPD